MTYVWKPDILHGHIHEASDLDTVKNGLGAFIVSTNQGLMTDSEARSKNVGGEVLCEVF